MTHLWNAIIPLIGQALIDDLWHSQSLSISLPSPPGTKPADQGQEWEEQLLCYDLRGKGQVHDDPAEGCGPRPGMARTMRTTDPREGQQGRVGPNVSAPELLWPGRLPGPGDAAPERDGRL